MQDSSKNTRRTYYNQCSSLGDNWLYKLHTFIFLHFVKYSLYCHIYIWMNVKKDRRLVIFILCAYFMCLILRGCSLRNKVLKPNPMLVGYFSGDCSLRNKVLKPIAHIPWHLFNRSKTIWHYFQVTIFY